MKSFARTLATGLMMASMPLVAVSHRADYKEPEVKQKTAGDTSAAHARTSSYAPYVILGVLAVGVVVAVAASGGNK